MIYSDLVNEGTALLKEADIAEAALDARLLLEYICQTSHNTLWAHPDLEVDDNKVAEYKRLLEQRKKHVPLQHLTGTAGFMGFDFIVNKDVLVPRQDTEFLVEEAMRYVEDGMRVLDMCTGSGCILISLMKYKNNIEGVGVDISIEALKVARNNAENLECDAIFLQGDLYEALENSPTTKFDCIISNPPYITPKDIEELMPEVKDYDPYIALCGGDDGLDFYRRIAKDAPNYLTNYGRIFLEIGYDQGKSVPAILLDAGFTNIECLKDYAGNDRVVIGTFIR